jgi:hypothetical protein
LAPTVLEPGRAPVEEPCRQRHSEGGEDEADVPVAADQHRQSRGGDVVGAGEGDDRPAQRARDHVGDQEDGDVVEHDGGDDLVRPGKCLEKAGNEAVRQAAGHAGKHR